MLKANRYAFWKISLTEAVTGNVLLERVSLELAQNSQENTCVRVFFLIKLQASVCNFIKKETLAQLFSCEFFEICNKTVFTEHLWATAPVLKFERLHVIWKA